MSDEVADERLRIAGVLMEKSAELREAFRQHNVGRNPGRLPRRLDLQTWADALEATANQLTRGEL